MALKNRTLAGAFITAILSLTVLMLFFGNLLQNLNKISFASGGDGLQSYVNMEYHIRFDTSYMRCMSMNYPYGEHVFFTNNQPAYSNTIKFLADYFPNLADYTLGILNFLMLFSLFITPVIIYYIFRHFKIGIIVSVLASVCISYLSPQIDRFGGHFNLSYICSIPWMILLALKFFNQPRWLLSVLIFLSMFAGALTHFYIYGFYALILLFFYAFQLFDKKPVFNSKVSLWGHFAFQIILPFLILQLFYLTDHVTDRPSYPWGFLYYRAYPQSIFLPMNRPYGQFLHSFINASYIDWEGYAYVGLAAFIGTLWMVTVFFRKLIRKDLTGLWQFDPDRSMNILLWASFAGLLYSFGIPFILGMTWLIDYIGPIRQMRGISRFSWLFFYGMNIALVYLLWKNYVSGKKKAAFLLLLCLTLIMTGIDAWYNIRGKGKWLENKFPTLTDHNLHHPHNQWIKSINLSDYQAFIPLPYFHIGSENIWIDGGCEIVTESFIALKNSGIPCMGVMLSRTSVSQTLENVSLMLGSTVQSLNMERFPSEKPFLLLVAHCDLLSSFEHKLINKATCLYSWTNFSLYKLPFRSFEEIAKEDASEVFKELDTLDLFSRNGLLSSDSTGSFCLINFDSLNNSTAMHGSGCLVGIAKKTNILYNGVIPHADTSKPYVISFWLNNINGDLYPRSVIQLTELDEAGNIVNKISCQSFQKFKCIENNKALIEFPFRIHAQSNRIQVDIKNTSLRRKPISCDDVLIRKENTNLYERLPGKVWKNNRSYIK